MTHTLSVQPLARGQESLWLKCGPDDLDSDALTIQLASPFHKPHEFLLFFDGDRFIGRMRGEMITRKVFTIRGMSTHASVADEDVARALASYLYRLFQADDIRVLLWEKPHTAIVCTMLEQSGFAVHRTKQFVERQLESYSSPYSHQFTYRTLADTDRATFVDIMTRAAEGDPFEDENTDPYRQFDELIEYAGPAFDPANWRIAFANDTPAGVVLPQLYSDEPNHGTLFYIGLLPEFRGRGLGKILHAAGLEFLSQLGALLYKGSTDARNVQMQRVFQHNGCRTTGTQHYYRPVSGGSTA